MARLLLTALLLLLVGVPAGSTPAGGPASVGLVARIGTRPLVAADLAVRRQVEQAYRGGGADEPVTTATAAVLLIQEALAGEVARALGVDATTTECEGLAAYADRTSQAPDVLARVKAAFGADRAGYLRLYIAPRVVQQKLRGYFVHSRELHREKIRAIEAAFAAARATSAPLASLAAHHGVEYTTFTLSEAGTSEPQGLSVRLEFRKDPLIELVRPLRPGETFHNIVENDEEFRIVRLLSREGMTTHTLECLVARKRPYDEWYRDQAERVPIVLFDPALAREIRTQYPTLPWWPQATVTDRGESRDESR